MPTYAETKQGYINLWSKAVIRPQYLAASRAWANRISANETRYKSVQSQTGAPWFFVGLIHMREGSLDFGTYLGNGQSIHRPTTITPAGRGPFPSFEAGAVDALRLQRLTSIKDWPISRILWAAEDLNGEGYFAHGINDPYVWSWTNFYGTPPNVGKYIADGQWSSTAIDTQPGVAAILGSLIVTNAEVAAYLATYREEPVAEPPTPQPPTPTPTPTPTPSPPDPDAMLIAYLQAKGKWPGPASISITTSGEVTIMVNGKAV